MSRLARFMETVVLIECSRCAIDGHYDGPISLAASEAERNGWHENGDGYVTCPRCSGKK